MRPPTLVSRREALALLALAAPAACSGPRPPPRPYGHLPLRPDRLAPLPPLALPALHAAHPIAVARFEDAVAQPVGGAYDEPDAPLRPPRQTYAFYDAALELSEHLCDALREAGLDARLAYAAGPVALADAEPGEGPVAPDDAKPSAGRVALDNVEPSAGHGKRAPACYVRGALLAWQHDVVRLGRGPLAFVHCARAQIRLEAGRPLAAPSFTRAWSLEGKAAPGPNGASLLGYFGRWVATLATADDAFLAALRATRS